jgi:hypothetical protein
MILGSVGGFLQDYTVSRQGKSISQATVVEMWYWYAFMMTIYRVIYLYYCSSVFFENTEMP